VRNTKMTHQWTQELTVNVDSPEMDVRATKAFSPSPPATRSGGKSPSSRKWSKPLPHSAAQYDCLPASRYSPYARPQRRKSSPRSITASEPAGELDAAAAGPRTRRALAAAEAAAEQLTASVASPMSAMASTLQGMAVASPSHGLSSTWPLSSRTRRAREPSFLRPPSHLAPLDSTETLSADLLTLVPGATAEVPAREAKTVGRRVRRLEPLPPDACPSAAMLGLAGLDDL
jgi:hypothetical protein